MLPNIPKISVVIITYNQEYLIKRAIDSLLKQRDYIYEICVSDDCSKDHTWDVLCDYDKQYPELFNIHRNEPNLGIFENIEYTWSMPTGDIVYRLAGDDECGDGWFKTVIDYIIGNNIDYKNELFCIFGDYKCVYPNGDTFTFYNKNAISSSNQLKLYERGLIGNRGTCYSTKILKKFKKVSQGRSYIAENAQDCQMHIYCQKRYYISYVGNIYYAAIGVSSCMSEERFQEHLNTMVYSFNLFEKWGVPIDSKDRRLPKYNMARKRFRRNPTLKRYVLMVFEFWRSFDVGCASKGIQIRHTMFDVFHKLPHKNAIKW